MKNLFLFWVVLAFYACTTPNTGDASGAEAAEEAARLSYVEPTITKVGVMPVKRAAFELEIVSNGRLEAQRKAVVPFLVQEHINAVMVKEGEKVTAGQTLGSVESFTYQKRLDEANNSYQQTLIDLEDRLLGYGYDLSDTAKIPDNIMKMAHIRSGYNGAVISLEEAKRNLAQTTIRAPISGVVTNLEARVNNPSNAYKNFCEILDVNTMHLVFYLLETELSGAKVGQTVELSPFAIKDETFKGTVCSINPTVNDKGMVRITATVPNSSHLLMDGMNARVLLKRSLPNCLIIPKEAVLYRQNRQVVFVYKDGKAIWTYVETSHENSTHVAVSDGLEEGMEVIVENNLNLAHESEVTVNREQ
ncbi:efflux RND transporter periplasmic adaptor subunit [Geofilum sp. OHC36d9]|uniref:efflux RND transporter periplasmic adaptor subunit n=1 Tax=Geofilum sp. OHC36d9 TaxID=3458413 RepID=UPI004034E83B